MERRGSLFPVGLELVEVGLAGEKTSSMLSEGIGKGDFVGVASESLTEGIAVGVAKLLLNGEGIISSTGMSGYSRPAFRVLPGANGVAGHTGRFNPASGLMSRSNEV